MASPVENKHDYLTSCPPEIILRILQQTTLEDIENLYHTCHYLNSIVTVHADYLTRRLAHRDFPDLAEHFPPQFFTLQKQVYNRLYPSINPNVIFATNKRVWFKELQKLKTAIDEIVTGVVKAADEGFVSNREKDVKAICDVVGAYDGDDGGLTDEEISMICQEGMASVRKIVTSGYQGSVFSVIDPEHDICAGDNYKTVERLYTSCKAATPQAARFPYALGRGYLREAIAKKFVIGCLSSGIDLTRIYWLRGMPGDDGTGGDQSRQWKIFLAWCACMHPANTARIVTDPSKRDCDRLRQLLELFGDMLHFIADADGGRFEQRRHPLDVRYFESGKVPDHDKARVRYLRNWDDLEEVVEEEEREEKVETTALALSSRTLISLWNMLGND